MKTLLSAFLLLLLLPVASQAATSVTCASFGSGGDLTIKITSDQGLDLPKARIIFQADGILHTTFATTVDEVLKRENGKLAARVSTLNAAGEVDQNSGTAEVELDIVQLFGDAIAPKGTGSIKFLKLPKVRAPLRLMNEYELKDCQGSL